MRKALTKMSDEELYELQNNVCKEIQDREEARKERIRRENLKFVGKTLMYKDGSGNTLYMMISDICPQNSDCMKVNFVQVSCRQNVWEDTPSFEISTGSQYEPVFDPEKKKKKIHYRYKEISNEEFWAKVDEALKRAREELEKTCRE